MKKLIFFLLLFTTVAGAQNGGTVESRYGIGELDLMTTSRQRGMGSSAVGLLSTTDINNLNPAAWSGVNGLRLQGGMSFEYIAMSRSDEAVSSGAIKGFSFLFPLEEQFRLRLVTSILPVSRSEYYTQGSGILENDPYTVTYEGFGGLSLFRAGVSAEPIPHIKIGAAFNYYFGNIDQEWELRFDNAAWFPARQRRATTHNGSGFLFGLLYDGIRDFHIGASVRPATSVRASRNMVFEYTTQDSTVSGASGTLDLPLAFSAGVAWQATELLLLTSEYSRQDWTDALMFDRKQIGQGEAYKWSVGAEWYPYKNDTEARTLSRTAFRFGFFLQQPYLAIDNETGMEYFITTGIGFPIFGNNRGDFALEYGWRGSESQLLGSQNILRATFSVTVGESWFIRKRD